MFLQFARQDIGQLPYVGGVRRVSWKLLNQQRECRRPRAGLGAERADVKHGIALAGATGGAPRAPVVTASQYFHSRYYLLQ